MKTFVNGLRGTFWQLSKRFKTKWLILMYHRVNEMYPDPWSLCVTPTHFAEHLEILKKSYYSIQLQQLVKELDNGKLQRGKVIVTLDDGYADNLHKAKPWLERYDIPATVFLATGHVGYKREFWWDELERLLLLPGTLPETLRITINGCQNEWHLGEDANYTEAEYRNHFYWKVWEKPPSQRHFLYISLWELLQPLHERERCRIQDELLAWAGISQECRPTHRTLSSEEVITLAQGKLIEVGAHSVTHTNLHLLPTPSQEDEIMRSKAFIEELLGNQVTSFAYPFGSYTSDTVAIVRKAGFNCACASSEDIVRSTTDRFQLPRFHIHDWNGEEFARKLSGWFNS